MTTSVNRREFAKTGAAVMIGATATKRLSPLGANEAVRLGIVGVGNRGSQLINAFSTHDDCQIVAAADVYQPYLARAKSKLGNQLETYEDYRKILERQDIDAMIIATPDHWHALQMVHAVAAGKDVYVEKPLSATVVEGRKMVEATRQTGRIVQVGLQRRSMQIYRQLAEYMAAGKLGQVTVARAYRLNNMFPDGIGKVPPTPPPKDLNWDLWLGPRPNRPYQANIAPYKFRWWLAFSSQMGNWGVHYFDAIRWLLGETSPSTVACIGGKYAVNDDRTIPDTAEAVFELPGGALLVFGQYEASSNPALAWGELELRGTQGTLYGATSGFRVITERGGQFQSNAPRAEPIDVKPSEPNIDATVAHARNFLDCIKSRRQPRCPVEEGHRSTIFAHLANMALATKATLQWNADSETCRENPQANELLHYEYRQGYEFPI